MEVMIIKNCKAGSWSDDLYTVKSLIVAQLCRLRTPLCEVTGNMLACCNIRSRDPTLHTYWWSVPGCNEMMMITQDWGVTGEWSHWPLTIHRLRRQERSQSLLWHLSVTHTEQLSPELFTSFVLLIIVRFKFFTLGKILRDIFLGHVESDCFIWKQASQKCILPSLSLSLSDPREYSIPCLVLGCVKALITWVPCSCFSLWAGGPISSRGSVIPTSWHDNVRILWEQTQGIVSLCSSFSRIFIRIYSRISSRRGCERTKCVCHAS